MPFKNANSKKLYDKQWRERNKNKIREYRRKNKDKISKQRKEIRDKRKKLGICTNCGRKSEGRVFCNSCSEKNSLWNKKNRKRKRLKVLKHYGGICACCGEDNIGFLTIDHIHGGGGKHRKKIGQASIYSWLIKNNFPEGFRVLCYNCNLGIAYNNGICPHKNRRE